MIMVSEEKDIRPVYSNDTTQTGVHKGLKLLSDNGSRVLGAILT